MLVNAGSATPANEIVFTVTVFANALSSLSPLDSLVLHHHTRSFNRTSWYLSFRLQLPRLLCSQFGSFAPLCFELRSIPQHLLTLASEKGASQSRSGLSQHRL